MIINAATGEILNAKKAALTSNVASSWDCDGQGNCTDPGTGSGQYTSLSACNIACNTTSINDITSGLTIYPNPVKNELTIKGRYTSINLFDIYGKVVLTSEAKQKINVSSLANGIYILNIITKKGIQTQKITITK